MVVIFKVSNITNYFVIRILLLIMLHNVYTSNTNSMFTRETNNKAVKYHKSTNSIKCFGVQQSAGDLRQHTYILETFKKY